MIKSAFISELGNKKLGHEETMVAAELKRREIPFFTYTLKRIQRRQLPIEPNSLVVGDMDCLYGALKQLKIPVPEAESYPTCLQPYLHRRVWRSTLGAEERKYFQGYSEPTFIKPCGRQKCFTGFVFESDYDFTRVYGVSRREPVYCSEVVKWITEHRVYVVRGEVRSIDHYDGDPNVAPDTSVIEKSIEQLSDSGQGYAAYGIDFGVLSTGETALIEMNDGFALGAYSIEAIDYTDLLIERWIELTANSPSETSMG